MSDTLDRAIRDAIARPLDGETFERCAAELLRDVYSSLRPVEGGNDAGMDGVGELPDGTPFFLVTTVQEDARGNLERNVKSHIDSGGERRAVVFATPRSISGRRGSSSRIVCVKIPASGSSRSTIVPTSSLGSTATRAGDESFSEFPVRPARCPGFRPPDALRRRFPLLEETRSSIN